MDRSRWHTLTLALVILTTQPALAPAEQVTAITSEHGRANGLGLRRIVKEQQGPHWVKSVYDVLMGDVLEVKAGGFEASFKRDAMGLELERTLPGGVRSGWQRDKLGRPLLQRNTSASAVRDERESEEQKMPGLRWKEGQVVSLRLKDGSYELGQLLKSPFMVFFKAYSQTGEWKPSDAEEGEPLLFCSTTKQFLKYSPIERAPNVRSRAFAEVPRHWIREFDGSRTVTIWPGTSRERSFILLSSRPGGQLIEKRIDASGIRECPVIVPSIPLDDDQTIDAHELNVLWTYPLLNERLYLSKVLGRCVDPLKDLAFDRPIRDDYATYMDMLARHGSPEDWGYSSKPYGGETR